MTEHNYIATRDFHALQDAEGRTNAGVNVSNSPYRTVYKWQARDGQEFSMRSTGRVFLGDRALARAGHEFGDAMEALALDLERWQQVDETVPVVEGARDDEGK